MKKKRESVHKRVQQKELEREKNKNAGQGGRNETLEMRSIKLQRNKKPENKRERKNLEEYEMDRER